MPTQTTLMGYNISIQETPGTPTTGGGPGKVFVFTEPDPPHSIVAIAVSNKLARKLAEDIIQNTPPTYEPQPSKLIIPKPEIVEGP